MFPTKLQAVLFVLAWTLLQYAMGYTVVALGVRWEADNNFIGLAIELTATFLLVTFALQQMQLRFTGLFHAHPSQVGTLLTLVLVPILLVVFGGQILFSNISIIYTLLFPQPTDMSEDLTVLMNSGLLGFFNVCVLGPAIEELLFRGIVLRGLLSHYSPGVAIVFSSVLFSLMHLNPDQLIFSLLIGMFLGWLYVFSRSLWPSIVAHMANNTLAYIISAGAFTIEGVNDFPDGELVFPSAFWQLVGLLALVAGIVWLQRLLSSGATGNTAE